MGLARQSVRRVADALVEDRMAAYDDMSRHRRAQLVRVTPRGKRVLRTIRAAQHVWTCALGARIGGADL
jgi:DNA-binding MarR family transcriptional regulator